ncbi:hypothetical protein TNCV_4357311 [Trichonephila clavipes]|nr:hypothetical protein TNCV_4357311 [Trichonephila clavipes]
MINGCTPLHVVANVTMTGQRYIDEVLLPHVRLFRGAVWQVAGRNYPPTNKNTLIRALTEEWDKLPQQLLDNVVQSMSLSIMTHFSNCANENKLAQPIIFCWVALECNATYRVIIRHQVMFDDGMPFLVDICQPFVTYFSFVKNRADLML